MPVWVIGVALAAVVLVVGLVLRAKRKRRGRRPLREPSAYVLLDDNAWDRCAVDDIQEPWGRYTTEPVRGFCGVPAGRHRIRTATANGEAQLDFVVYPGEVLAWRLDAERSRWEPLDVDPEMRSKLESAPASATDLAMVARPKVPGWLVHLRTTMNLVAARSSAPSIKPSEDAIDRVRKRLAKLVARAETGNGDSYGELAMEARGLGEALVGRPLLRRDMKALSASIREVVTRLSTRGDADRAMQVIGLGLAILPSDPDLMVLAGTVLAARGEADEALRALNAALERDRCLEAEDVGRAMRVRLELRSRLGLRVRVSRLSPSG